MDPFFLKKKRTTKQKPLLSLNKKKLKYTFIYIFLSICFVGLLPQTAVAQKKGGPPVNNQTQPPTGFQSDDFFLQDSTDLEQDSVQQIVLDTSDAILIKAFDPYKERFISDTTLNPLFTQFDPARKNKWQHVHAGNVGTQTYPLLFHSEFNNRGRQWRDQAFRVYSQQEDDFEFYRLTQAITRASFYMKPTTEKGLFNVRFGRSFANDLNVSLYYNKGSQSANFQNSETIFEDLRVGIRSHSINRAYNCFYLFSFSRNEIEHNNGIRTLTSPNDTDPELVSINSSAANTNIRRFKHLFRHSLSLGKEESAYKLSLAHQVSLFNDRYRFADTGINNQFSNTFYANFNALDLEGGLRMYSETQVFENRVSLLAIKHGTYNKEEPTERIFLLEGGISNQLISHLMEPVTSNLNALSVFGRLDWKLLENIQLNTTANLGFGAAAGSYQLHPSVQVRLKDFIELDGGLDIHALLPSFHQQVLLVNQQEIWANNFNTVRNQRIYGQMKWKKLIQFQIGLSQHSIQNYVYMDQNQLMRQADNNINIQQISAGIQLKLWRIHLDNEVYFQNINSTLIRGPKLLGNHSLYYKGHLFKKAMWSKFGFDLRAHDPFQIYAFQPAVGSFYLQDDFTTNWQLNLDGFFAFKIQKFRFTFRIMDILAPLREEFLFYQHTYAFEPLDYRLGISWDFVD